MTQALSQAEYEGLKYFMASFTCLNKAQDLLSKRMEGIPGAQDEIKRLCKAQMDLFDSILPTIPPGKLLMIRKELDLIELYIRLKGAAKYDVDADDHLVVPRKALNELTKIACDRDCMLCSLKGDKIRKCRLRKLLSETLPYELPDANGACVFQAYDIDSITGGQQ